MIEQRRKNWQFFVLRLSVFAGPVTYLMNLIVSHSYQADTQAGGTREREAILDGNVNSTG